MLQTNSKQLLYYADLEVISTDRGSIKMIQFRAHAKPRQKRLCTRLCIHTAKHNTLRNTKVRALIWASTVSYFTSGGLSHQEGRLCIVTVRVVYLSIIQKWNETQRAIPGHSL